MDSKLIKRKAFPKTSLLLKDYLLDDMSSCSSNGFKSFPRKQCCTTTVRFLTDIDLNQHKKSLFFNKGPPPLLKNPSKSAISAFQSVISAVKRLSFAARSSPTLSKSILPRNLSKKILKKTIFWKRIGRWKSVDQPRKEEPESLVISNSSILTTTTTTTTTTTNDSCSFTASDVGSSGNSSSEVNLSFTEVNKRADVGEKQDGDVSGDSTTSSDGSATRSSTEEKQRGVSGEKQQFSPVSVLDCPFQDDEEVLSPFQHMEGITKKTMEKTQRFGCLEQLEPVNLAKRFALSPDSDEESTGSHLPHSFASNALSSTEEEVNERMRAEQKTVDLLHQVMTETWASNGPKIKIDKLLLDLYTEKAVMKKLDTERDSLEVGALLEAWMNGRESSEVLLGWEEQRNRQAYMNDMERLGEWKRLDQEIGEMALELEVVVFDALFHELVVDFSSTTVGSV